MSSTDREDGDVTRLAAPTTSSGWLAGSVAIDHGRFAPGTLLGGRAASYAGRPVAFKVVGPWTRPSRMEQEQLSATQRGAAAIGTLIVLLLLACAVLLVRANLKSGRADRRGAGRIALFLLAVWIVSWVLGARHSLSVADETDRFFMAMAVGRLNVAFTWLFYLALEPFVRRFSPDMLIGWTRLLVGRIRDPRVGRDVLVGVSAGVLFVRVAATGTVWQSLAGGVAPQPQLSNMSYFVGARYAIADMLRVLRNALQGAMLGAFFYVLVLAIVRRQWIAATLVLLFVCGVLNIVPLTVDLTQPHAGISILALAIVAALALSAFYTSRAGEGMLRRLLAPA